MCGIAGIITANNNLINEPVLRRMSDSLAHRGPDGEGLWCNDTNTAGFSHRRLSIIDLTAGGAQPMHYLGRYTIVYNGEIYNYKELRSDLQKAGYHFKSQSDTEVILASYDFYKEQCVKYFDGMFAFAIWDERERILFTARDVFGEKPFYYYKDHSVFVFASEIKALWAAGVAKSPDEKMMINYLALGYVQNASDKSQTFFKDITALPPAHYGILSLSDMEYAEIRYKDFNKENIVKISEQDAVEQLQALLYASTAKRLRSDVPVGSSLSGGLDSSSIACIINNIQKNTKANPGFKAFSAVFPGFEKSEEKYIADVCAKFDLESFTVTPSANDLMDDIARISWHQDEPFTSSSIYAQYKVYELAKKNNIKVLLDGQGADETLAGYTKYLHWYMQDLVGHNKFFPAKREKAALKRNNIPMRWGMKNILASYLPSHAALALEKIEFKKISNSHFINANLMQEVKGKEWLGIYKPVVTKLNDILYFNTMQNGLEELLRYADRNSMAHGTEVRLPFLNTELVSFIFSLPACFKIKDGFTKSILRKAMDKQLPDNIVWRTEKVGFEPPQKSWMENKKVKDLFYEAKEKLVKEKILKPAILDKNITPLGAHETNNVDWRYLSLAHIL
jgi:asparagine synthase (glutamine-hydrolysing)